MEKVNFQYCRVSTTEQSSEGNGIESQKCQNDRIYRRISPKSS